MGYPILLAAGAALAAAGAGTQMAAASAARSAENQKVTDEMARQAQYQQQGKQAFATSLAQSSQPVAQQQMQQGSDAAMREYQKLEALPLASSAAPFQGGGSAQNLEAGRTLQSNQAQANLQGYTKWDLDQAIKNLTANQRLGIIGTNASRSAGVLPYEVQQAAHSQDTLAGIGGLLGTAGSLVGNYGALSGLGRAAGTSVPSLTANDVPFGTIYANQQPGYFQMQPITNYFR